jgi:glycosyltransferase involved in cell wall biosynthesis
MSIAATVITKNEAAFIRACLDSLTWADEIIVVDSGSTDGTVEICREYTDKIMLTDWPGPGAQRNRAAAMATSDWILAMDADEYVPPALRDEMLAAMANPGDRVAFRMPRLSSYCGRYMRHSGWWPDYITRLYRKDRGRFNAELLHDHMIVDGPVGRLKSHLMHEAFEDLEDVLQKINHYSSDGAVVMRGRGRRAGLSTALLHGFWSFLSTYILRAGFLDGKEGLMLAISNAEGTYYKYLKLMLLADKEK